MATLLPGLNHEYSGSALNRSIAALGHLNDVVSYYIHPRSHTSTLIRTYGHLLCAIINSETINLTSIIYMTIIFCSLVAPPRYPSMITL